MTQLLDPVVFAPKSAVVRHTGIMNRRFAEWVEQDPTPPRPEIACRLARARFWRNGNERFTGTHPDWPDAAYFLDLEETFAHAFVLLLSVLPASDRLAFAEAYYDVRRSSDRDIALDPRTQLMLSAATILQVIDVIERPDICTARILDLVEGAAQGDDLTNVASTAVDEVRKAVARVRLDDAFEDQTDPSAAAALALAEVLDPGGEMVSFKEVLARCAWAAVKSRTRPQVMGFLLTADGLVADSSVANPV